MVVALNELLKRRLARFGHPGEHKGSSRGDTPPPGGYPRKPEKKKKTTNIGTWEANWLQTTNRL